MGEILEYLYKCRGEVIHTANGLRTLVKEYDRSRAVGFQWDAGGRVRAGIQTKHLGERHNIKAKEALVLVRAGIQT